MAKNNNKKKSGPGRPSIMEDKDLQEKYIKIWTSYNFLNETQWEIAERFEVSVPTISNAISWVDNHLIDVPEESLLNGAIFAVKERMKRNTDLYEREHSKKEPSVRSVAELTREIRNDQKLLLELQDMYKKKYELSGGLDTSGILKLLTEEKKDK